MLIPFLPYLLAIAGLSAVLALPADGGAISGAALWGLYLALPLLGAAIGALPERTRVVPRRRPMRRRMLFLAVWLGVLAWVPLPAAMAAALSGALGWTNAGDSAALVLLLLNFWVGDALAASAPSLRDPWTRAATARRFTMALRTPVPILLLLIAGLFLPGLADDLLLPTTERDWALPWLRLAGSMGTMLLLAAVVVPVLIRVCWGLRPLPPGPARDAVAEELAANGVRMGAVLAWPEALMGHATAGVIGLLPRFRYLLLSPRLVEALEPDELRAVIAHEAGHVKHRHLWYFFAAVLAFILLMQVVATGLFWSSLFTGATPPLWAIVAVEVGALLVFFRFGIGFVSRHFERQADGNALRRTGPWPFEGALIKVARLNDIPPEQDNWHHYGIRRRIDYALDAHAEPERLNLHDRRVGRIKLALLVALGLTVGLQAAAFSTDAVTWLGEQVVTNRLEGDLTPTRDDLLPLQYLGARAVEDGDPVRAEHYFRLVLQITPGDPQALNNLAWVLVTRPEPQTAELREGLALARQAAQVDDQAYIWDTLAESYFRMEQYDDAVGAASKALRLAEAGSDRGNAPLSYYRDRLAAFSRGRSTPDA